VKISTEENVFIRYVEFLVGYTTTIPNGLLIPTNGTAQEVYVLHSLNFDRSNALSGYVLNLIMGLETLV